MLDWMSKNSKSNPVTYSHGMRWDFYLKDEQVQWSIELSPSVLPALIEKLRNTCMVNVLPYMLAAHKE